MTRLASIASSVVLALVAAALVLMVPSCRPTGDAGGVADGRLRVVVTVPPLVGIVRDILPPDAELVSLIAPGASEHGYEFTPQDVARLARADVVVYVGLDLEPKVQRFLAANPSPTRQAVNFADAVGIAAPAGHTHEHTHTPDGACCASGPVDQHLWLDPRLVRRLVPSLEGAVSRAMERRGLLTTDAAQQLGARARQLEARIDALDAELADVLSAVKGQAIVTHHNAWSRLADRYGLRVAAVVHEVAHSEPTPQALAAAVESVRSQGARGLFVEPQLNPAGAQRIAQTAGLRIGTLDPLGDGDWFALMRQNAHALRQTLAQ